MANRRSNVLFTSAGRRVSLIRQFKAALRALGDGGLCLTADASATAPAHQVGDKAIAVPRCTAPDYVDTLLAVCLREHVRMLVPLIDTELPVLAAARARFAEAGIEVLVASAPTIAIANDKHATARFFATAGFATPRIYPVPEALALPQRAFPLFVKPPGGSASMGTAKVASPAELSACLAQAPDLLVQELIAGQEYTIDVWVDREAHARCAVPRQRLAVRAGEVSKGVTVHDPAMIEAALAVTAALPGARGCLTVQAFKQADGRLVFIEINARFGGGVPLAIHAGANFPLWALQEARDERPDYAAGQAFRHGLMMLRYDDELLVDARQLGWPG